MSTLGGRAGGEAVRKGPIRLGEVLCERGLLTPEQLQAALKHQREVAPGKLFGEIVVDLEMVSAARVVEAIATLLDIPYVDLEPGMVHAEALECLPEDFLQEHNLLPLSYDEGTLTVAVERFTDVFLLEDIKRQARCPVRVVAAVGDVIRRVRREVLDLPPVASGSDEASEGPLGQLLDQLASADLKLLEGEGSNAAELEAAASDSPVVKLVTQVIENGVERGASDIHIEPDDNAFRVRYRVDGHLSETAKSDLRLLPVVVSRIKIMSGMDISERRLPQDGAMTVQVGDRPIDLRVSTMATKLGEKVVMRVVDRAAGVQRLDAAGFAAPMLAKFRSVVHESHGIVLVTGPTGSGKSTTLYGALTEIVSEKDNISTIEDPVERRVAGTNQFQVHDAAGFTFARALRSLLRQDPDVIMVGEIRDAETAKLATEAALTGHLVLSTLHTNDAPTAVPRLVNMGVEPYLIAASLRAVLAQRLVRRICPHCREVCEPSAVTRETLRKLCVGRDPIERVYHGTGCRRCRGVGYVGRVGVFELLLLNEEMLTGVVRDGTAGDLRAMGRRQGFTTMLDDGLDKVRDGVISIDGLLEAVSCGAAAAEASAQPPAPPEENDAR